MGLFSSIGKAIGSVVGGITGSKKQAKAAQQAGQLQYDAAMAGVGEQRRQFDLSREDQMPWLQAGEGALGGIMDLLGLNGAGAQGGALDALEASPLFRSLVRNGEEAIRANASATGGLRGGNIHDALSDFRADTLSRVIQQQLADLGGVAAGGQGSAQSLGQLGANTASNIGTLLGQGAAAQAGGVMAKGSVNRQAFSDLLNIGGSLAGMGVF